MLARACISSAHERVIVVRSTGGEDVIMSPCGSSLKLASVAHRGHRFWSSGDAGRLGYSALAQGVVGRALERASAGNRGAARVQRGDRVLAISSPSVDPVVQVRTLPDMEIVVELDGGASTKYDDLSLAYDGTRLVGIGSKVDYQLHVWDLETGSKLTWCDGSADPQLPAPCLFCEFSPTSANAVMTSGRFGLFLWTINERLGAHSAKLSIPRLEVGSGGKDHGALNYNFATSALNDAKQRARLEMEFSPVLDAPEEEIPKHSDWTAACWYPTKQLVHGVLTSCVLAATRAGALVTIDAATGAVVESISDIVSGGHGHAEKSAHGHHGHHGHGHHGHGGHRSSHHGHHGHHKGRRETRIDGVTPSPVASPKQSGKTPTALAADGSPKDGGGSPGDQKADVAYVASIIPIAGHFVLGYSDGALRWITAGVHNHHVARQVREERERVSEPARCARAQSQQRRMQYSRSCTRTT